MKAMVIRVVVCLVFYIFVAEVSALSVNYDFPDKLYRGENFGVVIGNVEGLKEVSYDVKIYVNSLNGTLVSQIYNGQNWQSGRNYYLNAYPSIKEFKVRVLNYSGKGDLCLKFRENGKTAVLGEFCRSMEILNRINSGMDENVILSDSSKEIVNDSLISDYDDSVIPIRNSSPSIVEYDNSTIVLIPKSVSSNSYLTKEYWIREGVIYFFLGFCVFVIVLLALRKL